MKFMKQNSKRFLWIELNIILFEIFEIYLDEFVKNLIYKLTLVQETGILDFLCHGVTVSCRIIFLLALF